MEGTPKLSAYVFGVVSLAAVLVAVDVVNVPAAAPVRSPVIVLALLALTIVAAQSAAPQHSIAVDTPTTLMLRADPQRLQQVFNNLLENAIRFSPLGGTIEVRLTHSEGDSSCCLEVRDYGLGVSREHREHLFDRFYRAHSDSHLSGLGLGLYVTRYLVERHGGRIEVQVPTSGGTRFLVRLPLAIVRSAGPALAA